MKVVGKRRVTYTTFATKPRFDGAGLESLESTSIEQTSNPTTMAELSRARSISWKRSSTKTAQKEGTKQGQKKTKKPC